MLELDRKALVLSRTLAVSTAVFLVALTLACFRRREPDATRILHRLSPLPLFRSFLKLAPWVVLPLVAWDLAGARGELGPSREAPPRSRKRITGARTWPHIATPRSPT